eukprot:CAMPEP_0116904344 /NCGR_PEP_ID=MMETSP0467-20121206/11361_1 /TAXON_ID=283647 /ORGANISM="Mesodinium pulex, Strain SPMC105" /LENGTH=110 /DNA_ID=CAMNT_0004578967 /DNA_START=211 /DNA_END=543 /DNA_ORIENTATION=+
MNQIIINLNEIRVISEEAMYEYDMILFFKLATKAMCEYQNKQPHGDLNLSSFSLKLERGEPEAVIIVPPVFNVLSDLESRLRLFDFTLAPPELIVFIMFHKHLINQYNCD